MAHFSEPNDAHLSDEDEGLDPRIQAELEALNSAADSINKLENELQRAKNKFRQVKAESSRRLSIVYKKIGKKWVLKARPYYDLLRQSQKAQVEAQKSAAKFQHANGLYRAAKETVALAEESLLRSDDRGKIVLDTAWQDMLNHATAKIMETEKEKTACEVEHQAKAAEYTAVQDKLAYLLSDIPRTINRARPFYEMKEKLELRLHAERQNAEDVQLALICSKQKYRMALISLEAISDEVHTQRRLRERRLELPLRTPGVGAEHELDDELSDMPSASLDLMSETGSQVSWDDLSDSRCVSPALSCDFDINDTSWADSAISLPGSDIVSPETPSNSSIWARFNSGISRFTQDLGKSSAVPSIYVSGDKMAAVPPRDDVIEGAECDTQSEQSDGGFWSISESFRKFSLSLSQSVNSKPYSTDSQDASWLGSKMLVAKSHSSNVLDESFGSNDGDEQRPPDVRRAMSLTAAAGGTDVTPVNSTTSVLNHSDSGPFTPTNASSSFTPSEAETEAQGSESRSAVDNSGYQRMSVLELSPARLAAKPPLPQRSGTMSPREASLKPRPTHRRSQSLQHFSPAGGGMAALVEKSSLVVQTDNNYISQPSMQSGAATTDNTITSSGTTKEIFV